MLTAGRTLFELMFRKVSARKIRADTHVLRWIPENYERTGDSVNQISFESAQYHDNNLLGQIINERIQSQ